MADVGDGAGETRPPHYGKGPANMQQQQWLRRSGAAGRSGAREIIVRLAAAAMAIAGGAGCGGEALVPAAEEDGEVESGELGVLEQALNSACGTFPPSATRTGRTGLFSI